MSKKLSYNEIKEIINKLSDKYDEYAAKHGASFFNKKSFEDRYMSALKSGMELQTFIHSEVAFFEDLKKKLEIKKEEKRIKTEKPFTKKVEKYIEELEKRWQKYPKLFSKTEISDEAQFLCGALQEFNNDWLSFTKIISRKQLPEIREYNSLTESIQLFIFSTKGKLPYEVENYMLNINRYGIEKAHMLFLKQGALLLKKAKGFLNKMKKKIQQVEKHAAKGNGDVETLLQEESLLKTEKKLEVIINDFRFAELI